MAGIGVKVDAYLQFLRDNMEFPIFALTKHPKLFTRREARDVLLYQLAWGNIVLGNRDLLFSTDGAGKVVPPAPDRRITVTPPRLAGVEFRYVTGFTKTGVTTAPQTMGNLDVRNLLFLYDLASTLAATLDVSVIYHIGFMFDASRTDCHGQGRALDFAGARCGGTDVIVAHHWTAQPVAMPYAWCDPATGKTIAAGARLDKWPAAFKDTYFRLDPARNPYLDPAKLPGAAAALFQAVYGMAAWRGTDVHESPAADVAAPRTGIGAESAYILHPDYKKSNTAAAKNGREAHWQHMHIQIGPTQTETNPP